MALIATVKKKFPRARLLVVTDLKIGNHSEIDPDIPILHLPLDAQEFMAICRNTLSSLRGCLLSHFLLDARFRSDQWTDWYEAFDTVLKREVYITVIHANASVEDSTRFQSVVALMAQAKHDHVPSVYLGGEYEGRSFACHEKWNAPSLGELIAAREKIDVRTASQILHTVSSVVAFWDSHRFPHAPLDESRVSLSSDGVVKVENCVDPDLPYKPLEIADLMPVAKAIQALMPPP